MSERQKEMSHTEQEKDKIQGRLKKISHTGAFL